MKRIRILTILLVIVIFGTYSCEEEYDPDRINQQDRAFVRDASFSHTAVIEFSEVARQKAAELSVFEFATRMIIDHTASRSSLDSIASALKIELPDGMDLAHQSLYSTLPGLDTIAFQNLYLQNLVSENESLLSLLQTQINSGNNYFLVKYAKRKLPVINKHLEEAIVIRDMLSN